MLLFSFLVLFLKLCLTACKSDHLYSLERELASLDSKSLAHYTTCKNLDSAGLRRYKALSLKAIYVNDLAVLVVSADDIEVDLDHLTGALRTVGSLLDLIRQLADEGMTMVIVTHEMGFAREVADRILFMADGVIAEQGTPAELFDNPKNPRTQQFLKAVL